MNTPLPIINSDDEETMQIVMKMFDDFLVDFEKFQREWDTRQTPATSSRIFQLNQMTSYIRFSDQIETLVNLTKDSLAQLIPYIKKNEQWPLAAHYSILRSAIETSSIALRLVTILKKNKQAWESLRLSYHDNEMLKSVAKGFKLNDSLFKENQHQIIADQKRIKDYDKRDITRRIRSIDIITEVDKQFPSRGIKGVEGKNIWNICSSFLHGNRTVLPLFSEIRFTGFTETGSQLRLTTSLLPTAMFITTIMENCNLTLEKYNELCMPSKT